MPIVTNNAKSMRGLTFLPEAPAGTLRSPTSIERVRFEPGESKEVDPKFLATDGAKALIAAGDLSLEAPETGDQPEADGSGAEPPETGDQPEADGSGAEPSDPQEERSQEGSRGRSKGKDKSKGKGGK